MSRGNLDWYAGVEGARGSDKSSSESAKYLGEVALTGGRPSSKPNTCFHFEDDLGLCIAHSRSQSIT